MRFWDVNFFDLSRSTRSSAAYWFWSHKSWGIQHVIVYLIIAIYLPKIRVLVMNQPQFNWACLQMRVYPCTSSRWPFHRENDSASYFGVPYFQTNPIGRLYQHPTQFQSRLGPSPCFVLRLVWVQEVRSCKGEYHGIMGYTLQFFWHSGKPAFISR